MDYRLDKRLATVTWEMYKKLNRRLEIAGLHDHEKIKHGDTMRLMQGCPMSVCALNAVMSVWLREADSLEQMTR